MSTPSLKQSFAAGVSWTATSQVVTQAVTFATTVVLARLLMPADFGLAGMAALYTGLISMVSEIGLCAALIQRRDVTDVELDTAFWIGLCVATTVLALALVGSPLAGTFFRNPALSAIVRVASFAFVLNAVGAVHKALLQRRLRFDRFARVEIAGIGGYGISAMALAFAGAGVWAIVVGHLVRFAIEAVGLWLADPWRPKPRVDWSALRDLFGFGVNVWGFNFLNYARENVDFLVVGRVLGAASLGFYTLGYNLANLPRQKLMLIIGRVTFPAFSRIQDDDAGLCRAYTKVLRYVSLVSFPLLTGLALVAPQAVPLVYGARWTPAVLPLQILCGAGVLYSLGNSSGAVFMAKGRPGLLLKITLVSVVGLAVLVTGFVRWGIVGVSAAVLGYTVVSLGVGQAFMNPLIGLSWRRWIASLLPAAAACVPMAAVVLAAVLAQPTSAAWLVRAAWLAGEVALGCATYLLALRLLHVREVAEVLSYAGAKLRPVLRRVLRRPAISVTGPEAGDVL